MSKAFSTPALLRLRADVVAVVERHRAHPLQRQHRLARARPSPPSSAPGTRPGSRARSASASSSVMPLGMYPFSGSCALVWSVRTSGTMPRRASSGQHVGAVAHQAHRDRLPAPARVLAAFQRLVEVAGHAVAVARLQALLDARRDPPRCPGSTRRSWSRPAVARRPCRPCRPRPPASRASVPPKCLSRRRRERLVRALHDALAADVDPRPRRHLAVHHQAQPLQPRNSSQFDQCPTRLELAISTRGAYVVRAEDAHRLARLHQQRLVVFERLAARARWRGTHRQSRAARPVPP